MLQSKDIDWMNGLKKKKDPYICCLQDTQFSSTDTHIQTESERMEKHIICKWKSKGSWSINVITDKRDFK